MSAERTTNKQFTSLDACLNYHIADRNDKECNLIGSIRRPPKRPRTKDILTPILFGRMRTRHGDPKPRTVKLLVDTGASGSIIHAKHVKNLRQKLDKNTEWGTAAGTFTTNKTCKTEFSLPELHEKRLIQWKFHVTTQPFNYDMIIGRDLLTELGLDISFKQQTITWDTAEIPMKPRDCTPEDAYHVKDSLAMDEASDRIKQIIDAKYEPANLDTVVQECKHLNKNQQASLHQLLTKYEDLFDGTLGQWNEAPYDIKVRKDATPYHARAYPIPRAHEATLKHEVERLCQIGVLKKVNRSEWAAPTFIIPKKDGTVRFISDFRELNKRIKRIPYPIPKIQDLLMKLEGFQYATSLDLNMGYYHIELSPNSKRLCTIVLPWGKYEYQKLPMGLCNSPDIFQERMSSLMQDLEYVRAYIDDLLILTKSNWTDHLDKLEKVLAKLQQAGLKVNAKKSFFGQAELEYLGYWITRTGIQPVPKKVAAIHQIAEPKTKRQLRRFIGMVNYYRDMSIRRSELLAPLTRLTSKSAKFQWGTVESTAFRNMKKALSRHTLLAFPDFNKPFDIHTDASHTQLGAVISQEGQPIAFYSRKLNPAQTRYTTTERELLAIVETLKEFRNILLGQRITVYTDHKNLTFKNFNTERVMRWRLILEEYGPELRYIKGENNIVADALSRLDLEDSRTPTTTEERFLFDHMAECFGLDKSDLPTDLMPVNYKVIEHHQKHDRDLNAKVKSFTKNYTLKTFHGGGKTRELICYNGLIVIPKTLKKKVVEWYHTTLCHPGETRTEQTIRQHFYWKNLRDDVNNICSKCPTCQKTKRTYKKYGHLPEKVAEVTPWDKLCVDLIGPYTIKTKKNKNKKKASKNEENDKLQLWCLTMIDPATGWFEMREIKNKYPYTIANLVEQTWLTRYPWPSQITYDKGTEFMREFADMIQKDYGIKRKGASVRNPQANAILERIHQTIGNIIRTFELYDDDDLDEEDPFAGVLSATMFAMRATYHTTTQATPSQLVFGRDAILNTKFEADWNFIRSRKQKIIKQNNQRENAKRHPHQYSVGDQVLMKKESKSKYGHASYEGPFTIAKVNTNGTVRIRKGAVTDTFNIRLIKPYRT